MNLDNILNTESYERDSNKVTDIAYEITSNMPLILPVEHKPTFKKKLTIADLAVIRILKDRLRFIPFNTT